jgi:hypothetical protein
MRVHQLIGLIGGDDWTISAVLLDAAGDPIDLTNATVQWTLVQAGNRAPAFQEGEFEITAGPDPGAVTVAIDAAKTTGVAGGQYLDYWRITLDEITSTPLSGAVAVQSDPFAPAAAAEKQEPEPASPSYEGERVVNFGASRVKVRRGVAA